MKGNSLIMEVASSNLDCFFSFYIFRTQVTGIDVIFVKSKISRVGFFEKLFRKEDVMVVLIFLGGVLIGSIVTNALFYKFDRTTLGTLDIDHSNPEKDVYLIRLNNFNDLSKKKKVVLKVNNDADLSQK